MEKLHPPPSLREALDDYDELSAQRILDDLFSSYHLDHVITQVVLPYLSELGDRWACGTASVAQEHFASGLLRTRLLTLSRGWGIGEGPIALLSTPPEERHDIALICFGLMLRERGWRIAFVGSDLPVADTASVAATADPSLIVLAATTRSHFTQTTSELIDLGSRCPIAIAGAGADEQLATSIGARLLDCNPLEAAQMLQAEESGDRAQPE